MQLRLGEGNTAALIFGQPLNQDSTGGKAFNPEDADPYDLEGFQIDCIYTSEKEQQNLLNSYLTSSGSAATLDGAIAD